MKQLIIIVLISFIGFQLFAQSPKREFRGAWVATVVNIDYPSSKTLNAAAQKQEWLELVDFYENLGFNALFVQIRPAADALYPSQYAPWSQYLTGEQGKAPEPYYDPLKFMIEETHKRGMEFHAWLNPYRATMSLDTSQLADNHPLNTHPDWMIKYGNKYYFNPALPKVQNHITDVVMEVVQNYDVDGIHFDDYFYPYKVKGETFGDTVQYVLYGRDFKTIEDWRRYNVDLLIEQLHNNIKFVKPHVRFGISPFGVWRNKSNDPLNGSDTRAGVQAYDDLYADILKWLENGWIDYVAPQLYWYIGFPPADYATLLDWWHDHSFGKQVYIGHAMYKVANDRYETWSDPGEIPRQIRLNRSSRKADGSIFFNTKSVKANPLGVTDSISTYYYKEKALPPEMPYLNLTPVAAPKLKKTKDKKEGVKLKWKYNKEDKDNPPTYYVIYRFENMETWDYENGANILRITPYTNERRHKWYDDTAQIGKVYTYAISAVNRQHSESPPSLPKSVLKKKEEE